MEVGGLASQARGSFVPIHFHILEIVHVFKRQKPGDKPGNEARLVKINLEHNHRNRVPCQ